MGAPSRIARVALVLLTILLVSLAVAGLPPYLEVLVLLVAAGATTSAWQFHRDATVGWATGVGLAALVVAGVAVQGATGLPAVGAGVSALAGAAAGSSACVLAAAAVGATTRNDRRMARP